MTATAYARGMSGVIALQGGAAFSGHDDLDRRLLAEAGADKVVVLPTADAFERPELLVASAMNWAERLGIQVEALMVMRRDEALDEGAAAVIRGARAVWLVGDNPIHLRSVVKDTPVWAAMLDVLAAGGLVVGSGEPASALCDPMIDPRGGGMALGLGLVTGMAVIANSEHESHDRHVRAKKLANVPLVFLPSTSALVKRDNGWETVGPNQTVGELPG